LDQSVASRKRRSFERIIRLRGENMSVEKRFWVDPYLTSLNAKVKTVTDDRIAVDKTIAFALSGGQESDAGTINGYRILKAEKVEKEIFYTLEGPHEIGVGDDVLIQIDWERRYRLMRLHFAAEIILELVNQHFGHPEKIGAHISDKKARVDFMWDGKISDTFAMLHSAANQIIESNQAIISDFSDIENEERYWGIKGFGKVPCGGTHIKTTGEIGPIRLKRDNIGKGKERIEIVLAGS
jgi:Ser-tRNA(Ala) deacylase AlaX